MYKIVDKQNRDFFKDKVFNDKSEIRFKLLNLAKDEEELNKEDLRKFSLNDLCDIWCIKIEKISNHSVKPLPTGVSKTLAKSGEGVKIPSIKGDSK